MATTNRYSKRHYLGRNYIGRMFGHLKISRTIAIRYCTYKLYYCNLRLSCCKTNPNSSFRSMAMAVQAKHL
jgi:hypothetical protein